MNKTLDITNDLADELRARVAEASVVILGEDRIDVSVNGSPATIKVKAIDQSFKDLIGVPMFTKHVIQFALDPTLSLDERLQIVGSIVNQGTKLEWYRDHQLTDLAACMEGTLYGKRKAA